MAIDPARRLSPLEAFCQDLIHAGYGTKDGIAWRSGAPRVAVEQQLAKTGHVLCEDGSMHNPRHKRFFAAEAREVPGGDK